MKKVKIAQKGYTLEVTSWENDGDNYRTKSQVFSDKNLAIAIAKMCETLFASKNRSTQGVGNSQSSEGEEKVLNYMKKHPELYDREDFTDDELLDICSEYHYGLLGYSEDYSFRVCESCVIYYSSKDIYLEKIKY
jgi:hypothetical protein